MPFTSEAIWERNRRAVAEEIARADALRLMSRRVEKAAQDTAESDRRLFDLTAAISRSLSSQNTNAGQEIGKRTNVLVNKPVISQAEATYNILGHGYELEMAKAQREAEPQSFARSTTDFETLFTQFVERERVLSDAVSLTKAAQGSPVSHPLTAELHEDDFKHPGHYLPAKPAQVQGYHPTQQRAQNTTQPILTVNGAGGPGGGGGVTYTGVNPNNGHSLSCNCSRCPAPTAPIDGFGRPLYVADTDNDAA